MRKATINLSLMVSLVLLSACNPAVPALSGLGAEAFEQEKEYPGSPQTVGQLSEAFVMNTLALRRANNKIHTVCVAAARCEAADPGNEG